MESVQKLYWYFASLLNARKFLKEANKVLDEINSREHNKEQLLFCILSTRMIETIECALSCAAKGYEGQAFGILRSVFEGLAICAILTRRPASMAGISTFELADRYDAFLELKRMIESTPAEFLSDETRELDLDASQKEFDRLMAQHLSDFISLHKRMVFERSRKYQDYEEEEFINFVNYTQPKAIKKPDIWKLFAFGKWEKDELHAFDTLLNLASTRSHLDFASLGSHIGNDTISRERVVLKSYKAMNRIVLFLSLWLDLVEHMFDTVLHLRFQSILKRHTRLAAKFQGQSN